MFTLCLMLYCCKIFLIFITYIIVSVYFVRSVLTHYYKNWCKKFEISGGEENESELLFQITKLCSFFCINTTIQHKVNNHLKSLKIKWVHRKLGGCTIISSSVSSRPTVHRICLQNGLFWGWNDVDRASLLEMV